MAAQYDALGNYLGDWETEEERRQREEEERSRTVQTETVQTAADGSQTVTTKREVPAQPVVPQQAAVVAPVAPDTFNRMVQAESGGRNFDAQGRPLTSPAGAMFANQVMPATAAQPGFGVRPAQAQTPEEYNRVGQEYYQALLRKYNGNEQLAAAAYNMGPGAVDQNIQRNQGQFNVAQAPKETQNYLQKIFQGAGQAFTNMFPSAQAGTLPQPQAGAGRGTMGMPQVFPEEGVAVATGRGVQGTTEVAPVAPGQEVTQPAPAAQPAPATAVAGKPAEVSPTQAAINRYQSVQDNPMALLALKDDQRAPEFIRNRAGERASELMRLEVEKRKAADEAKTLIPAAAAGDRKSINTITKELQNQDGSWLKMILLGFISPQLAGEEAIKLGFGNKWVAATDAKGNTALIQTNARGLPLKGFTNDGQEIPTDNLVNYATGAAQKLDIVGGTYVNDKTGEVGRVVTDQKTGQSYIQTDTGRKPMSGFRPQSSTGTLDMQRVQQIQKQNVDLAGDWAKLQMKVQGAAPEAANKFLGEFNAKFGTNYPLSAVAGSAPQISMETGQLSQAAPAAQPAAAAPAPQVAAPAAQPAPQVVAAPQAVQPVAPTTATRPAAPAAPTTAGMTPAQIEAAQTAATAGGKKEAEVVAEDIGKLRTNQPKAEKNADYLITKVDQLVKHPGFETSVGAQGASYLFGLLDKPLPPQLGGGDARDWMARFKEIQGQQFLQAIEQLRGTGAISEREGVAAQSAISRMSTSQTEAEFREAATDFQNIIRRGIDTTRAKLGQQPKYNVPAESQLAAPAAAGTPADRAREELERRRAAKGAR